jgi:predicted NUDIX family phosphoesterase
MQKSELISVVKSNLMFQNTFMKEGFFEIDQAVLNNINSFSEDYLRHEAEQNYNYQQIVSYIIFMHNEKLFLMQRSQKSSEKKLNNKFSIGIGGHLRKDDLQKDIMSWGLREFYEEVDYKGEYDISLLGMINDQSNEIGKLHLGLVYLMKGKSSKISIKSELKSGKLVFKDELFNYYNNLESWSKLIIPIFK